jgi:predicted dienelactone hydrolase
VTALSPEPEILELTDPSRPDWRDPNRPRPVRVTLWRSAHHDASPSSSERTPAVLISHGTGGAARQLAWLAEPLAEAGFTVAGVDHHGNNLVDGYLPQGFAFEWERARDLSFALDALSADADGTLGPVGAAGFSSGGYAAAALVGARISAQVLEAIAAGRFALPEIPEFPGLPDALRAAVSETELAQAMAAGVANYSDVRVAAAFLICPAIGRQLAPESLRRVTSPVRVWWAGADTIAPAQDNALLYRDTIPDATGESAGPNVEHYHFLGDNPNGAAVREKVATDAVTFFRNRLAAQQQG